MEKKFLLSCLALVFCLPSSAQDFQPDAGQPNALRMLVAVRFAKPPKTVQEAAYSILEASGYRMTIPTATRNASVEIMTRPVPPIAMFGTSKESAQLITIEKALLNLIGADSRLVVDHGAKLVAFEPNTN